MKLSFIGNIRKLKFTPNVVLEPTTLRLRESHALPTELAGHWVLRFEEGKYDMQVNYYTLMKLYLIGNIDMQVN